MQDAVLGTGDTDEKGGFLPSLGLWGVGETSDPGSLMQCGWGGDSRACLRVLEPPTSLLIPLGCSVLEGQVG